MKTYIRYILAVSLVLSIGFVAVGTAAAGDGPIWHNFTNETTLSGTSPAEAVLTDTAHIWQTQVEEVQKSNPQNEKSGSPVYVGETEPIWKDLCRC